MVFEKLKPPPLKISGCALNETGFYAKLSGRFSDPKTEVTRRIATKFGTNIYLINLKLLSKFQSRPNRSRVISKSLKFRFRYFENDRAKTKEHVVLMSMHIFKENADCVEM